MRTLLFAEELQDFRTDHLLMRVLEAMVARGVVVMTRMLMVLLLVGVVVVLVVGCCLCSRRAETYRRCGGTQIGERGC